MMNVEAAARAADVAPQTPNVAPLKGRSKKATSPRVAAPTAKKNAKSAKPKKTAVRARSKASIILALLRRKNGASLETIMTATGWQAHSVRGFVSLAQSKRGLKVVSTRSEKGARVYHVEPKQKGTRAKAQGKVK
jgi:hypothetical protein